MSSAYEVPCESVALADWHATAATAKQDGFSFFDFLTAVDQSDTEDGGFQIVLHLLDLTPGAYREQLITTTAPHKVSVRSLTDLWAGAAWHERETFEMFGVEFEGFDDGTDLGLRSLLLPGGFEGRPLRKSFVLAARVSKPWPGAKDPADSHTDGKPARAPRRRMQPPGIPDESWGPR